MSEQPQAASTAAPAGMPLPTNFAANVFEACLNVVPSVDLRDLGAQLLAPLVTATAATRASLMLVSEETGRLHMAAGLGIPLELIGRDMPWRPGSIAEWVLRERRSVVLDGEVTRDGLRGTSEKAIDSALCLPLESGDGVVGVLNLARTAPAPRFSEDDRLAVEGVLPPLVAAIERASRARRGDRLVSQLDEAAGLVGRTLLRPGLLDVRGWEMGFARRSSPLHGGDVLERVPHPGGAHSLLAADVAGHGVDAALTASFLHGMFTACASPERSASGVVARLNSELFQRLGGRSYAGLWSAQVTSNGQLTSCTAGYPPPLWIPADGGAAIRLACGGPPVGTAAQARWDEETVRMLPGDLIVVASDGVQQAVRGTGHTFGEERLTEQVTERRRHPADAIAQAVLEAVREWTTRTQPLDDLSVFVLRYRPEM